jgi:hypothetical protein
MTVTLNGLTLNVTNLNESVQIACSQWDAWENGSYKRKVKVRGVTRLWTVACVENNVNWASSQCKSFQDSAAVGSTVAFAITDQVRVLSTNVYILGVTIDVADLAGKNIRYFSLNLQEA